MKYLVTHELCEESGLLGFLLVAQELVQVILQLQRQRVVVPAHHLQHLLVRRT